MCPFGGKRHTIYYVVFLLQDLLQAEDLSWTHGERKSFIVSLFLWHLSLSPSFFPLSFPCSFNLFSSSSLPVSVCLPLLVSFIC